MGLLGLQDLLVDVVVMMITFYLQTIISIVLFKVLEVGKRAMTEMPIMAVPSVVLISEGVTDMIVAKGVISAAVFVIHKV